MGRPRGEVPVLFIKQYDTIQRLGGTILDLEAIGAQDVRYWIKKYYDRCRELKILWKTLKRLPRPHKSRDAATEEFRRVYDEIQSAGWITSI